MYLDFLLKGRKKFKNNEIKPKNIKPNNPEFSSMNFFFYT